VADDELDVLVEVEVEPDAGPGVELDEELLQAARSTDVETTTAANRRNVAGVMSFGTSIGSDAGEPINARRGSR
jgi:hypothetical protein